jgi:hypothetical protein
MPEIMTEVMIKDENMNYIDHEPAVADFSGKLASNGLDNVESFARQIASVYFGQLEQRKRAI